MMSEPKRIKRLARWGQYPVPFFVSWFLEGRLMRPGTPGSKPDFRVMSGQAWSVCLAHRRCWICGDVLGSLATFVAGPLSILQRGSVEPPSHRDCAEYAVRTCPHMLNPGREKRDTNMPTDIEGPPDGLLADYNPGIAATYVTRTWQVIKDERPVFILGSPVSVSWWREGRPASRREIINAMELGLPDVVDNVGLTEVHRLFDAFLPLLPP
jgi:hypothetical protein